jgi:hypothetical protein
MSIGIPEKRVLYDNPCAPIVKFSKTNSHSNDYEDFDEEDMTDDQSLMNMHNDNSLHSTLGSLRQKSLFLNKYFFRRTFIQIIIT